ncbi:MAG: hypothetical protein EPN85_09690, partial [Bacteroidetes bacterium]
NLSEFNAKLIVKPDDLKSSTDKKKKDESLMYLSPDRNQIYYSSYGEDGKNGRDIYYVTRSSDGELSKPTRVSDAVNTKYDEDYAFLHPSGQSLYFCSKGHNSMGGYDIFKSEWNNGTQAWGKPVNMDFAINTPDDDILFISDTEDKSAYFSSRRESPDGHITVYKIKLDRKPLDLAVITGTLTKTVGDRMAKATITVTKILKDEVVGVFNTNAADGTYTLKLPNGGKFMFSVESAGFKKSSELVVIPSQQEIKPMKQKITLMNESGQDKMLIKNEFDAQVDSADLQLAVAYLKAKASLEVSPAEEQITTVAIEENAPTLKGEDNANNSLQGRGQKNVTPVTNTDIIEMAYQDAKETQKEANDLLKNSETAKLLSRQKNELSIQKYNEAQDRMKTADAMTNQEEKTAESNKAAILKKESEVAGKESALSLTLSNQMETQATAMQQQADAELKYAKDLDNAIKTGANENKMNDLLAQKENLDKKSEALDATFPPDMSKEIAATQSQASKSLAKYLDVQQDVEDIQSEAKRLRAEAEKTKNDGVKQNLNQQAGEMEKEAETKKKEAEVYNATALQQQSKVDSLKNTAAMTTSMMKQIQGSSPETTTASANTPSNTTISSTAVNETTPATTTAVSGTTTQTANNATTETTPMVTKSPYVDVFVNRMHEAEKKPNELEREETLSVVYQVWTDSLDKQIADLNKQLSSTKVETHKTQIQNKIYELQSSVEDKRQKAADSRSKVDNLKLQQALAEASSVTPATTNTITAATNTVAVSPETIASATITPENITGTKNINSYYETKLTENATISNEYEKKVKEQTLYEDWAASLYDESQRLKKDGSPGRADDAVNESKAKQALAIQSADEVTKIKAEKPELVATANLAPAETTTMAAPEEAKQGTSATTAVTSNTVTAANTVPAESTTPTSTTNTTTTSATTTSTEPTNQPAETKIKTSQAASQTKLSTIPPATVAHKDEYTRFVSLKNESDWAKNNAERQFKQAADAQKEADKQFSESQELSQQITKSNDPNERKNLQNLSGILDKSALKNQARADSIKTLAKNSEAESNSKRVESDLYMQSLDKATYEEISTATGYKTETLTLNTTPSGTKTESFTQPASIPAVSEQQKTTNTIPETNTTTPEITVTKTETGVLPVKNETAAAKTENISEPLKYYDALFDKLEFSGASYSATKPIPIDAPMPEGLVFKVQIGAFRNPIPQDLFKGIKPISAETTPQGLKRYTAGLFQKFETANNAKNRVNGLGYRDAFIVAFFNGKRISMNEALAKARESGEVISPATTGSDSQQPNVNLSTTAGTNIANATDVKSVSGLFYTIQIGVFSMPVNSTQLYDIAPLNSERTDNGLIRYTTGRFDDETKAVRAKNNIAQKGISDAFVIAYRDGKRISLSAARSILNSEGSSILAKDKQEYTFVPSDTTTSESSGKILTDASNKGIVFKVQVGAFKEQVPVAIANKLLANSNRGIKTFRDDNGLLVYTIGEYLEYESANSLKTQLVSNGLSDAFVIAFKDGKKITASAALEIIKNK